MTANGHLPLSELAPIPGGYLRRDAAAAFNAMDHASLVRYNVPLRPFGPMSSYRNYDQQQQLWQLYKSGRGNLAAVPGTSNHGWGLAVDFATPQMRGIVDRIGATFGWSKRWSDAPSEWWHVIYKPGIWAGASGTGTGPTQTGGSSQLFSIGSTGDQVAVIQQALRAHGHANLAVDGVFGPATEQAVRAFQAAHHLQVDGIVGPATMQALGIRQLPTHGGGGVGANLQMFDSVDITTIPPGARAVAGYVGGSWPTYSALVSRFPHALHLSIAVNAGEDADCLDIEVGDATPADAPRWVRRQEGRGVRRPVVYASLSTMPHVLAALSESGIPRSAVRVWTAHYTNNAHLCNPGCGLGFLTTADATQWTDRALGRNLDESLCAPHFF